jgi:SAM-dependent methyltransferase
VKKVFATTKLGRNCFANEKAAYKRFLGRPWMSPCLSYGLNWFVRPWYPDAAQLPVPAETLDAEARSQLAGRALSIVLDLYVDGFAHRDFKARNLFYTGGNLVLIDFETMTRYADGERPRFTDSYDITGQGLESPYRTNHMGFAADRVGSVCRKLNVEFGAAMEQLRLILKRELREASITFNTHRSGRHSCRAQRTYNAFTLPKLTVHPDEAQRDCARRFERYGVTGSAFAGKRILDLGSNVGGMLFEAQKFKPATCVGLEYDHDKVAVANRVAAFNDLPNIRFIEGDVDAISARSVEGPYDVVFCLAIDAHLRRPERLHRLLGALTKEVLYFEGNASTDPHLVEQRLLRTGFRKVQLLGACDDDCLEDNNRRPLLRAWK